MYGVTGSLDEASRLTDIPKNQLKVLMTEQWWTDTIKQIRQEENDLISAKMTHIIDNTLDAMQDRLENGDSYIVFDTVKDEEGHYRKVERIFKLPVKMKDLTMPAGILTDKRQLLRGEATSITGKIAQEDILKELGQKFESFAKQLNIKEPELIDVTDVEEIKENGESKEEESV